MHQLGPLNKPIRNVIEEYDEQIRKIKEGNLRPLRTGWTEFDRKLYGGLMRDRTIVIGAKSGAGKTSFLNQLIVRVCQNNPLNKFHILYFNFEISAYDQITKFLSCISRISYEKIIPYEFDGKISLTDAEEEKLSLAKDFLLTWPIEFVDDPCDIVQIHSLISQIHQQDPEKHIVCCLDHLLLANSTSGNSIDRFVVDEICKGFMQIKKEFGTTNILLSQLTKETEDKTREKDYFRPRKKDLKESGGIEQAADSIILIHNPNSMNQDWKTFGPSNGRPCVIYKGDGRGGIAKDLNGNDILICNRVNIIFDKARYSRMGDIIFDFYGHQSFFEETKFA